MAELGINHFVSNITEGLASPNKYEVNFGRRNRSQISLMCNVAQMPGRSIKTYENRHYGVPFKLPYATEYSDITFSFITQIGFAERKFFEDWQAEVINPQTGILGFYDNYKGDIRVSHLSGKDGTEDYAIELYEAFPVAIGEVGLGYSITNETIVTGVTFTYRNWKSV